MSVLHLWILAGTLSLIGTILFVGVVLWDVFTKR